MKIQGFLPKVFALAIVVVIAAQGFAPASAASALAHPTPKRTYAVLASPEVEGFGNEMTREMETAGCSVSGSEMYSLSDITSCPSADYVIALAHGSNESVLFGGVRVSWSEYSAALASVNASRVVLLSCHSLNNATTSLGKLILGFPGPVDFTVAKCAAYLLMENPVLASRAQEAMAQPHFADLLWHPQHCLTLDNYEGAYFVSQLVVAFMLSFCKVKVGGPSTSRVFSTCLGSVLPAVRAIAESNGNPKTCARNLLVVITKAGFTALIKREIEHLPWYKRGAATVAFKTNGSPYALAVSISMFAIAVTGLILQLRADYRD